MKKIVKIIILFLIIININNMVYAESSKNLKEQKKELGVEQFLKEAKKYSGNLIDANELNDIFENAVKGKIDNENIFKKIINLFEEQFSDCLTAIGSILAIIIIHSILKSITESLENEGITKLVYYVQYILIVTVIMSNFSDIIEMVKNTSADLILFMNMLIPVLASIMLYTGSLVTSGMIQPILLFIIAFVGNIIQNFIIPLVLVFTSFVIISKISDNVQIAKITKFFKSSVIWFFGIVLTIFVGVISLEGTLSSGVDGITAKTAKAVVSSAVPVVGKILGDAVDSVLGCGIIIKNAVGLVGVVIVLSICLTPIIKLSILSFSYKIIAAVTQPIADKKITSLLEQIGDVFKVLLAILSAISVMFIIGIALVLKISNSGMMYK